MLWQKNNRGTQIQSMSCTTVLKFGTFKSRPLPVSGLSVSEATSNRKYHAHVSELFVPATTCRICRCSWGISSMFVIAEIRKARSVRGVAASLSALASLCGESRAFRTYRRCDQSDRFQAALFNVPQLRLPACGRFWARHCIVVIIFRRVMSTHHRAFSQRGLT